MEFGGKAWIRWPIGLLSLAFAFKIAFKAVHSGGGFGIIGVLLVAVAALVFATVCISPELVGFLTRPMTRWIDGIYLPGGRADPAPLNYRLSSYYETTRQFDLAVAEYERILYDYPEEPEAYAGLVRLFAGELDNRRAARRWLKTGLRKARQGEELDKLREEFAFLLGSTELRLLV